MHEIDALVAALSRPQPASSDFDLNPDLARPSDRDLRPAAVLVAIWHDRVVLTKRASHLQHHPGQIAFPGGKVDAGDVSPTSAALREAHEEVGLPPDHVEILGTLPLHRTVTGFVVTPVLGRITRDFQPAAQAGEVEEVFTVPVRHLLDPANYAIEQRLWRGDWRRYYAVPYGPYYIWGATARILRGLADRAQR
jgi:8-oxo-dGTP pyrophosphatase MutT (NUDIX family)